MPLDKRTGRGLKFSDREICKYALEGLCPYGLFRNTKSDLGEPALSMPCTHTHGNELVLKAHPLLPWLTA